MSKQQPRKKGNLQPASSTRAAALLTSNSGGLGGVPSTIGFVGFDGLTGSGGGGSLPEEFGPDLDAELRIVFRKLSKKDAVTREKALKELIELLSAKDDAAVEAAALCWTRPYSKLTLDGGFKVRAGSHNVMSAFAARLGRSLGKMVKQIVPYLILGMSDPYREVAQAAESCFESAFREEKRLQAVRLCSSETMTICTELLSSTGALFNPQKYDTEETEEMRQTRLISSALLAIHRVVSDSTDTELTSLRDHLARSLWTDNKFWKTVCKHKSGAVRAATFRLLRTWIERFATDFETFAKSAATAIVAALEDSDISVAKNAFDCWLLCLGNEDFWKNVNIEKAVIPKFLAILRSDSASTSAVIGPCLLPSFSAILARVETDKKEDFMRRWINSLIQGMTESPEKTPLSSAKPKNDAWIAAFVDCFKFCISNANGSRLLLDEMLENLLTVVRLALDKKGSSAQVVSNAVAWTVYRSSSSAAVPNFVISHFVEQLTEEVVKRSSDDGAAVEFVEHIVASGADSLGAALASQLFHHCLNSLSSVHSSTTMASIAASKRLNTPAFWEELQKLGWKSTDEVVLRLVDLVVAGQVDAVSVPAHVSTVLTFVSELCADGVAEQTLRRLSQCDNVVVRKALLGEARKRLALKPIQDWIATADFKEFWLRCLQEAAVEQDADLWSTLMEYTSHFISSTRVAEQAVVEETLVALSTILTAWCQSMITERSADRCLTMIVQLVRVIFDSGHISSDSTSLEVIVRQIWILLLDSATHLSDSLAASLEEIVSKAVTVRKSDDLYSSLTQELTTRLDTEVFSVDRMQWFISCALRLSAHKEEKLNAFRLSAEAEKKLLASIGRQYALMFWLGDSCPIPLTKPESCESAPLALRSFINRTVFSALLLMDCGGNCWSTASPNKSSPPIATSVIAVAALVRVLAAEDALDSHTESLTCSLQPALELLRTDSAGRFALVKQLLRSALASPDAISLLSLSLLCELLDADERRDVERSLASEVRDAAVDVEKVALVGTALRVPMTGAIKNRQGTPLGKWTLIFQLAAAAYDNETALALFDVWLAEHQEEMQTHLLLCCDGSAVADWSTLAFNCALIRFLCRIAEDVSTLNAAQRDFLCCSLVSWLQTCEQMVESGVAEGEEFSLFSCHVLSLFDSCARQAASDKAVTDFVQEWNEFFAESCANSILPWLFSRCDGSAKWDFVCDALCGAVTHLNKQALLSVKLPTLLDPEMEKNNYSAGLQSLLLRAAPLLRNRHRSAQLASWSIITNVLDDLYTAETLDTSATADEETTSSKPTGNEAAKTIPTVLKQTLDSSYGQVEAHMSNGADAWGEPDLLAFLLAWDSLLGFMVKVPADQRPKYSTALTEPLDRLMITLFAVMPERPYSRSSSEPFGDLLTTRPDLVDALPDGDVFVKQPVFAHSHKRRTRGEMEHLACNIFYRALATFPALVRHWHHAQSKAFAATISRYTTKYVSPILSAAELDSVGKSGKTFDTMTVTVRPSVREVIAKYQMEDTSMELTVTLPADYPLTQATVSNDRAVVGVEMKRRWLLQLTVFLAHQNGSLLDGLLLWKRNIDRHIEGVEDCPICMMTVHSGNYQLPKVCCRQCKKRFHGACLYKWFESSNQSSCPLCRALF